MDRIPTQGITQGLLLDTVTRIGTETADQGHSPIPMDIIITIITTPTEGIPGHSTEMVDVTIGALHNAITLVPTIIAMTHHTKDHPYIEICQLIQKIAADPDHVLYKKQVRKCCIGLHLFLAELQ